MGNNDFMVILFCWFAEFDVGRNANIQNKMKNLPLCCVSGLARRLVTGADGDEYLAIALAFGGALDGLINLLERETGIDWLI